ncbi:MAG: hypothetical protein AABW89_02425 [Nanoarchaeota archaeon]
MVVNSKKVSKTNEILFKKGKIQELNRIAFPKELLNNLGLEEGDLVNLYLNHKNSSIVIKKEGVSK